MPGSGSIPQRVLQLEGAMGLDSLYRLLKPEFGCSRKRVHRQMQLAGISSARRRAYKKTTHSNHSHPIAPNLLQRNFSFDRPDQAWVGDITYIPTGEGWLYLAIVKDLCTRKIVGYAFSDRIDTRLTLAALDMAYRRRKPAQGLIFHSDRGVQYAAQAYRERLEAYGIRQSMSRRGDPYDNAVAENFFSCLKCELVHLKTSSAASSVSWSTSSTTPQGLQHRTMCLLISKPSTTPSAPILPLAGVRLHALRLNLPLPPPDCSTFYLCVFIRLFPLVLCPFLGEGLTATRSTLSCVGCRIPR